MALLDRTSSLELMTDIGAHAERLGFESVRTRSLARQIELMQRSDRQAAAALRAGSPPRVARRARRGAKGPGRGVCREPPDSRRRPPDRRLLLAAQAGPRGDRRADARRVGVVSGAEKAVHVRGRDQVHADRRLRPGARAARAASCGRSVQRRLPGCRRGHLRARQRRRIVAGLLYVDDRRHARAPSRDRRAGIGRRADAPHRGTASRPHSRRSRA